MKNSPTSLHGYWMDVDGGQIYAEARGAGFPVILVHAGIGDRRLWDPVMLTLSDKFRVIRYDIRGYGNSPAPRKAFSPVADLAQIADSTGPPVVIIGISIGALIAVDYALLAPRSVRALVLTSPRVSGDIPPGHPLLAEAERAAGEGRALDAVDLELRYFAPLGTDSGTGAMIRRLARENAGAMLLDEDLVIEPAPAWGRLHELMAPVLIITGQHDVAEIKGVASHIQAHAPDCRSVVISDADHLVPARNPEDFTAETLKFLGNLRD